MGTGDNERYDFQKQVVVKRLSSYAIAADSMSCQGDTSNRYIEKSLATVNKVKVTPYPAYSAVVTLKCTPLYDD